MPEKVVSGFDALLNTVEENKGQRMFVLFTGSKDDKGVSWCPDCNVAFPVITKMFKDVQDTLLIICEVGDRPYWKDPNNDFRKKLSIKYIPTLMNWDKKEMKLEESECLNEDVVSMMLEE